MYIKVLINVYSAQNGNGEVHLTSLSPEDHTLKSGGI